MKEFQRSYSQTPPQKKSSANIALLAIPIILVIVIFYNAFIKSQPTIISGINFLDKEITIEAANQSKTVASSEMFSFAVRTRGEIIVTIKAEGEIFRENKYLLTKSSGIILEIVSNTEQNICIVRADVSDMYYKKTDAQDLKLLDNITTEEKQSYYYELPADSNDLDFWVYPGRYEIQNLPKELPQGDTASGLFLVDCGIIDDTENLKKAVLDQFDF